MPSRRTFLKFSAAAAFGALVPPPGARRRSASRLIDSRVQRQILPPGEWPAGERLGRGALGWGAPILTRPHPEGRQLGYVYPDDVVRIVREVVGLGMAYHTHVWFELEEGYVYSPHLQPVMHLPQTPLAAIPEGGAWGELVTPWVKARVNGPSGLVESSQPRDTLYYSSVFALTDVLTGPDGQPWYRATMETGYNLFVPASTFRVITADEVTPLSSEVDPADKRVVVYLAEQALSAFEGQREVFRARISSGANYFGEDGVTILNGTPIGEQHI